MALARLTEIALLGCLVQRAGGRIRWNHKEGTCDRKELASIIRGPARKEWDFGRGL